MTTSTGRGGLVAGALYTACCTVLAALVAVGTAPTVATPALLLLLLPAAIVPFGIALNLLMLAEGALEVPWVQLALVLLVAVSAGLQAWMFRTMARNWRTPDAEIRPAPVSGGAATGL